MDIRTEDGPKGGRYVTANRRGGRDDLLPRLAQTHHHRHTGVPDIYRGQGVA